MPRYEYKVVPAPAKGLKARGVKGPEARFSNALETLMNTLAEEGWEYQRAETLPSVERAGIASTTTEWRNVLVFRREKPGDTEAFAPELLPPPDPAQSAPEDPKEPPVTTPEKVQEKSETTETEKAEKAEVKETTGDAEGTDDTKGISATLTAFAAHRNKDKSDD